MGAPQAAYTFTPQERIKRTRARSFSLFQYLSLILFGVLLLLVAVGGVIIYQQYRFYLRLQHEIATLSQQKALLDQRYQKLTAREEVIKKAKLLGLHPPRKDQIVELELK